MERYQLKNKTNNNLVNINGDSFIKTDLKFLFENNIGKKIIIFFLLKIRIINLINYYQIYPLIKKEMLTLVEN